MADAEDVRAFLAQRAEGDLLAWSHQVEAMHRFSLSCAEAESLIFEAGLIPKRYARNQRMIPAADQKTLFESRAAIIGCGGLGGYVLEEMARMGVGHLVAVDPDVFEEHNLNRQLLSNPSLLGTNKATAAVRRVAEVNPAVEVRSIERAFASDRAEEFIARAGVVVDALDSVEGRLDLAAGCAKLGVPLVSGSIAGWFGYVTTVFPGERTLEHLYSRWSGGRGIEADLGNPAFTPAAVASLQVAEAVKVLLGTGTLLRNRVLCVNLLDMDIESVPMGPAT